MIAAAVLTLPELIAGQSLGRGDGATSIIPSNRDRNRNNDSTEEQPPPEDETVTQTVPAAPPETVTQTTPGAAGQDDSAADHAHPTGRSERPGPVDVEVPLSASINW